MMRHIFVFLLLIPLSSFSQYHYKADTSCYSSQHIAVPNDSTHQSLFNSGNKLDLFNTVYYLNRKHLLDIYAEKDIIASCCIELFFTDYKSQLAKDSSQHIFRDYEMQWDVEVYGFLNHAAYREPLLDENYEYVERIDEQGNISLVYPDIDTTYFGFVSIPEIRIVERRYSQEEYLYEHGDEAEMKIERFGFTAFDYSGRPELFWVDFNLFISALWKSDLKTEDLPWYEMMVNRTYDGFRYKQTACNDNIDRD